MPFGFHFHVYRIGIKGPDHWEELHQMAISAFVAGNRPQLNICSWDREWYGATGMIGKLTIKNTGAK